ncbi:MAG: Coenzyme F420 hydrogenase/dehydrogenase, beta subunit C-terminal domain [Bacteroidaceae bacterium]|nr:Coenzyme F420 hydrogenase/dehydrogenase, beta subunit C-terminal domain [Bacteroidaceae bacterium]
MMDSNNGLKKFFPHLCDEDSCTGCLSCYNVCRHDAISLRTDDEGFIHPMVQSDLCVGCKQCENACPIQRNLQKHPVANISYAAWTKDKSVLRNSSSGGIYSVIADYVLKNNGIVYGAAFDEKWNLRHIATTDEDSFSQTRGSKYVASSVGTTFREVKEHLSHGIMVLYSGTPCQIAGLKSYLEICKCNTDSLFTIDLVCHGVPSPIVFKANITFLENKFKSKIKAFSFREKKWSWLRFNQFASFENGAQYRGKWEEDCFYRGFLREYYLRPSCYQCLFATESRCGDFTLCDYWGYYKKKGETVNKDWGVSLVIPNSKKAKELWNIILPQAFAYQRDIHEAMNSNQAFHQCFKASPLREDFWKDFRNKGFEGVIDKYLFPDDISPQFKRIYRLGRNVNRMLEIMARPKRSMFNILRKLRHES